MRAVLIFLLCVLIHFSFTSCASYDLYPFQRHHQAENEKLFYELDHMYVMEERRTDPIYMNDKVFVQGVISTATATFYRLPFQHYTLKEFDTNLTNALKKHLPKLKVQEDLLWTDKYLPEKYALQSFDPKEVKHSDLLKFSSIRNNELVLIPLVSVYVNERIDRDIIVYKLNVALFVIDSYQIYHARSMVLSKSVNLRTGKRGYRFNFSETDWDFLINEALGDLVEAERTTESLPYFGLTKHKEEAF